LSRGRFLTRLHPAWSFPAVFAFCYLLTATLARRGGWHRLVLLAAGLSASWLAFSILATRAAGLWVDLAAPLAALWILVGLLLAGNGVLSGKAARPPRPRPAAIAGAGAGVASTGEERPFDVFLSHNGKDKPAVRELAKALEARGLKPWLDENELAPGRPWQEALEESIAKAGSAAVLVGADGLGPWETIEMRASLSLFVNERKPVIPVLLPGCGEQPNLPLFLTQFTWVDLRDGLGDKGLDRLEWGITGRKPAKAAA
jgi:nucleotide-binding universal stress UspA family protein